MFAQSKSNGPALFGGVPQAPAAAKPNAPRTFYFQKNAGTVAPAIPEPAILQTGYQPLDTSDAGSIGTLKDYGIQLEPPDIKKLPIESERQLKERVIAEIRARPLKPGDKPETNVEFPVEPPLTTEAYAARSFNGVIKQIEPAYVCHDRLYFQQLNSERYGWDLGFIHPFVSAGEFTKDYLLLPYNFATRPCQRFECSAGYCLPGDPVPYLIYPLEFSVSGGALEACTAIALFALIP